MSKQTIDLGIQTGDGKGDGIKTGGKKINDNFDELYLESIWAFFVDGTYLDLASGFVIAQDTRTKLENDATSLLSADNQGGGIINGLWNPTFDAVNPLKSGDAYDIRVNFMVETGSAASGLFVNLDLDVGSPSGIIWEETKPMLKGANTMTAFSFAIHIFANPPFFSNDYSNGEGGVFFITANTNITIYDIRVFIIRTHLAF